MGGSTITQQLARNIFLNFETTYSRMIQEMFIAVALEQKYSKEQILEFYLNNVYFSNGYYGIESAAEAYFNKDALEIYALGPMENREAVLLFNEQTRLTADKTIEYYI